MTRPPRWLFYLPALIALVWLGWWLFGQPPEQQVRRAQEKFLAAVEKRDWKKVQSCLATDYSDALGLTQETAPGAAAEVLNNFLLLTLNTDLQLITTTANATTAQVQTRIQMEGRGLGLSAMIMDRVNTMQGPWQFHWRKDGPWHWNWKLTRIHHPELYLPPGL